ncbi:MAG: outer membrane lipoprotein-sorting protein [Puniceicoccaceae bacterium]
MKTSILLLSLLAAGLPQLQGLTGSEIADRAAVASYYQGDDGRAEVTMTITDGRGRERKREMVILRRDSGGDLGRQRFYVYFRAPGDVSRTAFLVWKNPGADDDRWLYLPALDLIRRISASDERTSFVGSHFFYEDVSGRSPSDDEHTLADETDVYYVLDSTPKDPDSVEFASYRTWIHKESFIPVKTEYRDADGETYRTYEALGVETIDGRPTVVRSRMSDAERGGNTVLTYANVRYDLGLGEDLFTERYLRNPPEQVR